MTLLISVLSVRSLAQYCSDNGRVAECPIRMFKNLLLKIIYDLSDVDVVEHSLYDLSFKYFLGMAPEETSLINPSSLCKFRKLCLKDSDLMSLLIDCEDRLHSSGERDHQVQNHYSRFHAYRFTK